MYSEFTSLHIGKRLICLTTKDNKNFLFMMKDEIDFTKPDDILKYENGKQKVEVFDDCLKCVDDVRKIVFHIFIPKEVRYYINKDKKHQKPFDLNYRQHIRIKFSKMAMQIIYCQDAEYMANSESMQEVMELASFFSTGEADKPLVVISPLTSSDNCVASIYKHGSLAERFVIEQEKK
jgi:hypothetical protein